MGLEDARDARDVTESATPRAAKRRNSRGPVHRKPQLQSNSSRPSPSVVRPYWPLRLQMRLRWIDLDFSGRALQPATFTIL